jgi:hypothetical protein
MRAWLSDPLLSRTSFHMFSCQRLGIDEGWHPDDYNVDCDGSTHTGFRIAAALGVLVYPIGIPVSFFLLLRHDQKQRVEKAKLTGGSAAEQESSFDFLRSDFKVCLTRATIRSSATQCVSFSKTF